MPLPQPEATGAGAKPRRWPARILARWREKRASTEGRRSDLTVAALGITLGLCCALFPWYIFFNQEKFGIKAVKFEGTKGQQQQVSTTSTASRIGAPSETAVEDTFLPASLDLFATGTAVTEDGEPAVEDAEKQDFPGAAVEYRMVYASAGRAMIADDTGFWVVQRGSLLPDNSTVASIEQRDGSWVLVTSTRQVIPLTTE